YQHYYSTPYSF
nr:immunoglobulin light chain junction region [Macaca mulatta]